MKASELKRILSQKIDKIEDDSFLEALITIVDARIKKVTTDNTNHKGKNKISTQNNANESKNNEVDDSENDSLKWLYDR
jgi:hypothetical protein